MAEIARSVTGNILHFVRKSCIDVTFEGETREAKLFVEDNTVNLFGTD